LQSSKFAVPSGRRCARTTANNDVVVLRIHSFPNFDSFTSGCSEELFRT
jgi:hypothetical protein